jgi:hypothetical protein
MTAFMKPLKSFAFPFTSDFLAYNIHSRNKLLALLVKTKVAGNCLCTRAQTHSLGRMLMQYYTKIWLEEVI